MMNKFLTINVFLFLLLSNSSFANCPISIELTGVGAVDLPGMKRVLKQKGYQLAKDAELISAPVAFQLTWVAMGVKNALPGSDERSVLIVNGGGQDLWQFAGTFKVGKFIQNGSNLSMGAVQFTKNINGQSWGGSIKKAMRNALSTLPSCEEYLDSIKGN